VQRSCSEKGSKIEKALPSLLIAHLYTPFSSIPLKCYLKVLGDTYVESHVQTILYKKRRAEEGWDKERYGHFVLSCFSLNRSNLTSLGRCRSECMPTIVETNIWKLIRACLESEPNKLTQRPTAVYILLEFG